MNWFMMRMLFIGKISFILLVSTSTALKCRTREHMKQQQDFYNLAGNCMKASMNITSSTTGSGDYNRHQQQNRRNRPNNYDDYDTNRQTDNRYNRNKISFTNDDDVFRDNMCNYRRENSASNRKHDRKDDVRYTSRYRKKRDTMVQKYARKNSTTTSTKKSPLEEISALNSDMKADRQAMSYVMTNRIQNPELREFIQDSIEECFDIMDPGSDTFSKDGPEEQCELSKKLILCLEEKAKRGCEDWEVSENSTTGNSRSFNFNKQSNTKNENDQQPHQKYRSIR